MVDHLKTVQGRPMNPAVKEEPSGTWRRIAGSLRDLSKLPRWASDEIRRLEADARKHEREAAAMGSPEARIVANPYDPAAIGLDERTTVRFKFANSNGFVPEEGFIDVSIRDGVLKVNASDILMVQPWASNDLHIMLFNSAVDRENQRRLAAKELHGVKVEPR